MESQLSFKAGSSLGFKVKHGSYFGTVMATPLVGKANPAICILLEQTSAARAPGKTAAAALQARNKIIIAFSKREWELAHPNHRRT